MSNPRAKPIPPTSKPTTRSPPIKNPTAKKPVQKTPARPSNPPSKPSPANKPAAAEAPKAGNWINRTVQNSVAGVGNYAGGFINGIGSSVNKVGEGVGNSISNTTRGWGQGVAGYGNDIKDSVGVGGPRVSTGGNPLGLAGQGSSKNTTLSKPKANNTAGKKASGSNPLGI